MTISIEEMRSFAAVAAQGTFSAAARALGRSQSVVSTHIAGMENELGIRLFVRGTPAKLTPAGEELLPGALRVLREAERFESRASELFRLPEPLLYMGIDMALERLILRTKKDEVPPVFAKWWAAALRKTARRLGLVQPESM